MKNSSLNSKKIALNGILGALAVVSLLLAAIIPTNTLSFYALSSFFISVVIVENGIRAGWLFFAATSLLSLIVVPEKLALVPYVVFFGIYGIVKYYIEKLNKLALEYVLKFIYFNICAGIAVVTVRQLFNTALVSRLPWWLLVIALEVVFFVYDYVYTLFIGYYRDKLRSRLK
ncbi:MAG: hypothetical protein ABFD25_14115 [Clostridiaceae bacterium]